MNCESLTLTQAVEILNHFKHRGFDTWTKVDHPNAGAYPSNHPDRYFDMPEFDVIAIAERYAKLSGNDLPAHEFGNYPLS
jgi:hypothetical protein